MFTCLEVLPENEGMFSRIYERIRPPQPIREYVQVPGGTPFLRLKVRENHVSWTKISSSLGKNERRILSGAEVSIPECANLRRAEPTSLGINIMLRKACTLLTVWGKPEKISFSLYDKEGFSVRFLEMLAPVARYVSVYTEKIREYFYAASEIMEETGMSIKINEYESPSPPGEIIVADRFGSSMKKAKLVFLPTDKVIAYNTVTGEGFRLEEEYRILKSECIDDFLFASALYEYNNVLPFAERDFDYLCLAGRRVSDEILVSKLI